MVYTLDINSTNPMAEVIRQEMTAFLDAQGWEESDKKSAQVTISVRIDRELPEGAWRLHSNYTPNVASYFVQLLGHSCVEALHAVYDWLEESGWVFLASGPVSPVMGEGKHFTGDKTVVPEIRWRGIRQHVNFPQDVSAWRIGEAQEYLRRLARQRFNVLTIHSYPRQWIAADLSVGQQLAGEFFYGERIPIPPDPSLQAVVQNKTVFCNPDIEAVYNNPEERSRMARAWMGSFIQTAKQLGFRVRFSFEPRSASEFREDALLQAKAILSDYPGIDVLEPMTRETGGGR